MKLIDTFSFSEEHEKELLLLKFILEAPKVDEWVIVENDYTFRGEFKGYYLDNILNDPKFNLYINKIEYIQCSFKPIDLTNFSDGIYDDIARKAEERQREFAKEYILSKYNEDAILFLSDVDEMIDFTNDKRAELVFNRFKMDEDYFRIPHVRYWYDFDNLWSEIRSIPAVKLDYVKKSKKTLSDIRFFECGTGPTKLWSEHVAFEYSFCFSKESIIRKYETFFHTGMKVSEIELAIKCNHIPVSEIRNKITIEKKYWLKKVKLNAHNSPSYVRNNLEMLRTNVVHSEYVNNRKKYYPDFFSTTGRIKNIFFMVLKNFLVKIKNRIGN